MCWFFIVIKVLMLKLLLASISGLSEVGASPNYEYGYHPSAEEFDNLLRETHRTWTHDILKKQSDRELYRHQAENQVNTFVPKFQYENHHLNKYFNNFNNIPTTTPTSTTTSRPKPHIFSQDLQESATNNRYQDLQESANNNRYHFASNMDFHLNDNIFGNNGNNDDDDEVGNQIYEGEVDMKDNAVVPFQTKPANFPEINLKPIHPNELEKYSLNNLYKNNTRAHFPIYFTNPSTGIVYAITEMGKSPNNTLPRTNGSIPIFITKEQYERDIQQLKQEYEQQCKTPPADDKDTNKINTKFQIPSSFSRPQKNNQTSVTTMRPQIIRLNSKPNTSAAPSVSKLITPLKKPSPVIVRTELTVKDKIAPGISTTTARPSLNHRLKLKNKRKNKKSKPPGHRISSTAKPRPTQGLLAPGGGPPILVGKRTTTRRPYEGIYKLATQLEKPNFGTTIFSTAPITATATSKGEAAGGEGTKGQLEFINLDRKRRSANKQGYEEERGRSVHEIQMNVETEGGNDINNEMEIGINFKDENQPKRNRRTINNREKEINKKIREVMEFKRHRKTLPGEENKTLIFSEGENGAQLNQGFKSEDKIWNYNESEKDSGNERNSEEILRMEDNEIDNIESKDIDNQSYSKDINSNDEMKRNATDNIESKSNNKNSKHKIFKDRIEEDAIDNIKRKDVDNNSDDSNSNNFNMEMEEIKNIDNNSKEEHDFKEKDIYGDYIGGDIVKDSLEAFPVWRKRRTLSLDSDEVDEEPWEGHATDGDDYETSGERKDTYEVNKDGNKINYLDNKIHGEQGIIYNNIQQVEKIRKDMWNAMDDEDLKAHSKDLELKTPREPKNDNDKLSGESIHSDQDIQKLEGDDAKGHSKYLETSDKREEKSENDEFPKESLQPDLKGHSMYLENKIDTGPMKESSGSHKSQGQPRSSDNEKNYDSGKHMRTIGKESTNVRFIVKNMSIDNDKSDTDNMKLKSALPDKQKIINSEENMKNNTHGRESEASYDNLLVKYINTNKEEADIDNMQIPSGISKIQNEIASELNVKNNLNEIGLEEKFESFLVKDKIIDKEEPDIDNNKGHSDPSYNQKIDEHHVKKIQHENEPETRQFLLANINIDKESGVIDNMQGQSEVHNKVGGDIDGMQEQSGDHVNQKLYDLDESVNNYPHESELKGNNAAVLVKNTIIDKKKWENDNKNEYSGPLNNRQTHRNGRTVRNIKERAEQYQNDEHFLVKNTDIDKEKTDIDNIVGLKSKLPDIQNQQFNVNGPTIIDNGGADIENLREEHTFSDNQKIIDNLKMTANIASESEKTEMEKNDGRLLMESEIIDNIKSKSASTEGKSELVNNEEVKNNVQSLSRTAYDSEQMIFGKYKPTSNKKLVDLKYVIDNKYGDSTINSYDFDAKSNVDTGEKIINEIKNLQSKMNIRNQKLIDNQLIDIDISSEPIFSDNVLGSNKNSKETTKNEIESVGMDNTVPRQKRSLRVNNQQGIDDKLSQQEFSRQKRSLRANNQQRIDDKLSQQEFSRLSFSKESRNAMGNGEYDLGESENGIGRESEFEKNLESPIGKDFLISLNAEDDSQGKELKNKFKFKSSTKNLKMTNVNDEIGENKNGVETNFKQSVGMESEIDPKSSTKNEFSIVFQNKLENKNRKIQGFDSETNNKLEKANKTENLRKPDKILKSIENFQITSPHENKAPNNEVRSSIKSRQENSNNIFKTPKFECKNFKNFERNKPLMAQIITNLKKTLSELNPKLKINPSEILKVSIERSLNPDFQSELKEKLKLLLGKNILNLRKNLLKNKIENKMYSNLPKRIQSENYPVLKKLNQNRNEIIISNKDSQKSVRYLHKRSASYPNSSSLQAKPNSNTLKPNASKLKPSASNLKPNANHLKPNASNLKPNASLPKFVKKSSMNSTGIQNSTAIPGNSLNNSTQNPNYSTNKLPITANNRSTANAKRSKFKTPLNITKIKDHKNRKSNSTSKRRKSATKSKKKRKSQKPKPSKIPNLKINNSTNSNTTQTETTTSRSTKETGGKRSKLSKDEDEDYDFFDAGGGVPADDDDDDEEEDDSEEEDDDDEDDYGDSYESLEETTPIEENVSSAEPEADFGALPEEAEQQQTTSYEPELKPITNSYEESTSQTKYDPPKVDFRKRIRRRPGTKRPSDNDYEDDDEEGDDDDGVSGLSSNLGGFFRMIFYPVQMVFSSIMDTFGAGGSDLDNRKPAIGSAYPYPQYTSYHNTLKQHSNDDYVYDDEDDDIDDYDGDSGESSLTGWFSSLFGFNRRNKKITSTTISPAAAAASSHNKPGKTSGNWFQSWFGFGNSDGVDKTDSIVYEDESEYDKWFSSWFGDIKPKARKRTTTTTTTTTQLPQVPILTIVDPMRNPQNWIGILAHHIINQTSTTTQSPLKEIWSRVTSPATTTTTENPDIPRKISYNKYQIWRLKPQDDSQVQALEDYKNSDEGNKLQWLKGPSLRGLTDVLVPPRMLNDFQTSLSFESIDHEVLIFDVGKAIAYEKSKEDYLLTTTQSPKKRHNTNRFANNNNKPLAMTWMRYYEFDDIVTYLENMRMRYPQLVELIHIGRSYEGRPLIVMKIESKEAAAANSANLQTHEKAKLRNKKKIGIANAVFIEGGTHGAEWIAPATATWIINELLKTMKTNKSISDEQSLIRNTTWYIMPVLNPDGYVYSHEYDRFWKKSRSRHISRPSGLINSAMTWLQKKRVRDRVCYGVDLDRNWNYQWGKRGSSRSPCSEFFAGPGPFSEPETKALSEFLMDYRSHIKLYISMQAYGQIISYPYKANTTYDAERLDDFLDVAMVGTDGLRKKGSKTRYKIDSTNDLVENRSGCSDAFVAYDVGIPFSYTMQLADNGVHGYLLPSAAIESTSRDAFEIILAMLDYI
ncbi:protein PFC0760c [Musca domestica]|uniref:Protein PFC0760c n=1 Tax=Musca domestica TaxID=7370 RepID=A0ABM3UWK6_MUSDO|nr:protein PFC0760c [Musca domestica]